MLSEAGGSADHDLRNDIARLHEQVAGLVNRVAELESGQLKLQQSGGPPSCWTFFCVSTGLGTGRLGHTFIAIYLIAQWMFFSCTIILYNKYILHTLGFPFPLTIVLFHMLFAMLMCHVWKRLGWVVVPNIKWADIFKRFAPVAIFFGGSLAFSNAAYLFISVAFIQMMKASMPVWVLLVSFAFGLEKPSGALCGWIIIIVFGVGVATVAQVNINFMGMLMQGIAMLCEALRLAITNKILVNKGLKLVPVAFLYYMAPLCAGVLLLPWAILEAPRVLADGATPIRAVGGVLFVSNMSIAFLLNLSTMALIKHTSALTMNVSGVIKDLALILWSVFVNGAAVSVTQYVGYTIAASGVAGYSEYKRRLGLKKQAQTPAVAEPIEASSAKDGDSTSPNGRSPSTADPILSQLQAADQAEDDDDVEGVRSGNGRTKKKGKSKYTAFDVQE